MNPSPSPAPLVSVVIPAYKARWLLQALESVRRQTHRPLEIVVCDDSAAGYVQTAVEAFAARVDFPVRYSRNPTRLWEVRSTARAISLAEGEYIKFLHDDDVLHEDCIATLLESFERVPGLALATARRRLIDEAGMPLPDELPTAFPANHDVCIDGRDLIDFFGDHTLNFLGEPSVPRCWRWASSWPHSTVPTLPGWPTSPCTSSCCIRARWRSVRARWSTSVFRATSSASADGIAPVSPRTGTRHSVRRCAI